MAGQAALLLAVCAVLSAGLSLRMDVGAVPTPDKMADAGTDIRTGPIIGILSQEISPNVKKDCDPEGKYSSYIAASYVKFIEDSGGRVVPILTGQPRYYYTKMAKSVNGVLFPGGQTSLHPANGYGASSQAMLSEVKKINNAGGHLPVLGICLGMQLIAIEESGGFGKDLRDTLRQTNKLQLPLDFIDSARKNSTLFKDAPENVIEILSSQQVMIYSHVFCVTEKKFRERGLSDNWKILSKNRIADDFEFISSFEAKKMPIFAVQFHPEKTKFERKEQQKYKYNRSESAVRAARHFADVLVSEAGKNNHSFESDEETRNLIKNYKPTKTGDKIQFEEIYFFEHNVVNTRLPTEERSPVLSAYIKDKFSQTHSHGR